MKIIAPIYSCTNSRLLYDISVDRQSKFLVKENSDINSLDIVACYKRRDLLSSYSYDSEKFSPCVFSGEYVNTGSAILINNLNRSGKIAVKSNHSGIAEVSDNCVNIFDLLKSHDVISGVEGRICLINKIDSFVRVDIEASFVKILFSSISKYSGIFGVDLCVMNGCEKRNFIESGRKQFYLFRSLSPEEFEKAAHLSKLNNFDYCILSNQMMKIFLKEVQEGRRIFLKNNCLYYQKKENAKIKTSVKELAVGDRVCVHVFNADTISGRIISMDQRQVTVASGNRNYIVNYLNVWKE